VKKIIFSKEGLRAKFAQLRFGIDAESVEQLETLNKKQ